MLRALLLLVLLPQISLADPVHVLDLANVSTSTAPFTRVFGSDGDGFRGVPLGGGFDVDGDGHNDSAFGAMIASPLGRTRAGQVYLVFGSGRLGETLDTDVADPRILRIIGDGVSEVTGSEVWMDDVTGDGLGDVLIARQNHRPDFPRPGAGALTILVGDPAVRTHAANLVDLDLAAAAPPGITLTTFLGAGAIDRLGIWMRTGDVTGDGVADIVVGADQEDRSGETDSGAVYVIRGGPHLAAAGTVDLALFGSTALAGHVAKVTPPPGATEYHFGATCQIADLDAQPGAEVIVGAALNRSGAAVLADGAPIGSAHPTGGSQDGTVYIVWAESFAANPWPAGYTFDVDAAPGDFTIIDGAPFNVEFGEELLGGLDYDGNGLPELFVGDITGDLTPDQSRSFGGTGHVFWNAALLRGLEFDMGDVPELVTTTTILGAAAGHIAGDTATQAEYDGDAYDDLMFAAPHASPAGRVHAGMMYVIHGRPERWPGLIDLAPAGYPDADVVRITEIWGANGEAPGDGGDTLAYSAASGDLDGDGRLDILTNEMLGNGPGDIDPGNLIIVSGALVASPAPMPALGGWGALALGLAAAAALARSRSRR